jgi:hypothetical protein
MVLISGDPGMRPFNDRLKTFPRIARVFSMMLLAGCMMELVEGQEVKIRPPNYDESKVPQYTLTSPLAGPDGKRIESADQWSKQQEYLVKILATHEYGFAPQELPGMEAKKVESGIEHEGTVRREQWEVTLTRNDRSVVIDLLLYLPADKPAVGCFVGLNFRGNHTVTKAPEVRLPKGWVPNDTGAVENRAGEEGRGESIARWPIAQIVGERHFAVATAYCGDIDPDFDDGFTNGVHSLYPEFIPDDAHPDRWGTISAWAWGMSRMVDALEKHPELKSKPFLAIGHSRLGKTALWAGAQDSRMAIVYSNNSGCGGAALSKRAYGESVARINQVFPHWFCRNFRQYNDREESLPIDQHLLIAAIAPRPVYISSATEDQWADPLGEYLSGWYAGPAYELLGHQGLPSAKLPEASRSVGSRVGYHLRVGKHDILLEDWNHFADFASRWLGRP